MKIRSVTVGETVIPPEFFSISQVSQDIDPEDRAPTIRINDPDDPWTCSITGMTWREKNQDLKDLLVLEASRPTKESHPDDDKRVQAYMDHTDRVMTQTRSLLRRHVHEVSNLDLGSGPIKSGEELMDAIEKGDAPSTWAEAVQVWARREIERLSGLDEGVAKNSDASSAS